MSGNPATGPDMGIIQSVFCEESGERNMEKLYFEMLNHFQNESSVGEYATVMCRYFMQL
jgi:hypothetical protein